MKREEFLKMLGFGIGSLSIVGCETNSYTPKTTNNVLAGGGGTVLDNVFDLKTKLIENVNQFKNEAQKYENTVYEKSVFLKDNHLEIIKKIYPDKFEEINKIYSKFDVFSENEKMFRNKGIKANDIESILKKKKTFLSPQMEAHTSKFGNIFSENLKSKIKDQSDVTAASFSEVMSKSLDSWKQSYSKDKNLNKNQTNALDGFLVYNEAFPEHFPGLLNDITINSYNNNKNLKKVDSTSGAKSLWSDFWKAAGKLVTVLIEVVVVAIVIVTIVALETNPFGEALLIGVTQGGLFSGVISLGILVLYSIIYFEL